MASFHRLVCMVLVLSTALLIILHSGEAQLFSGLIGRHPGHLIHFHESPLKRLVAPALALGAVVSLVHDKRFPPYVPLPAHSRRSYSAYSPGPYSEYLQSRL